MKTARLSINRWMDKNLVVHQYNGIYLSHKKRWTIATCSTCEFQNNYTGCKKHSRERWWYTEWFRVYESKLMIRKYEVIYRDRKKFSGCLGRERGAEEAGGTDCNWHAENFGWWRCLLPWVWGWIHCYIHISKYVTLRSLITSSSLYSNYIYIKVLKSC